MFLQIGLDFFKFSEMIGRNKEEDFYIYLVSLVLSLGLLR